MNITAMPFEDTPDNTVQADSFYPELSTQIFTQTYGIANEYSSNLDMMLSKITDAAIFVNSELAEHHTLYWAELDKLTEAESPSIDDESQLVFLYKKAVYSLAKAKLLMGKLSETHRDKQQAQQDMASDNEHYWRNESFQAINAILGTAQTLSAELI